MQGQYDDYYVMRIYWILLVRINQRILNIPDTSMELSRKPKMFG